jgi:hypothetical protein
MKSIGLRTFVVLAAVAAAFAPTVAHAQLTTTTTTPTLTTVNPTLSYGDDTTHQLSFSGSKLIGQFPGLSGAWAKVLMSSAIVGSDYQNLEISLVPQSSSQSASVMNFEIHAPAGMYHARFTFQLYSSAQLVVKLPSTSATLATCNMTTSAPTCDAYFENQGLVNPSASLSSGQLAVFKSVTITPTTLLKH